MEIILTLISTLLSTIAANVISYYICKLLDRKR